MLRRFRRLAIAGSLIAPLLAIPGPVTAQGPQTWTFPSGACAGTLQDCIDAAGPGDTVKIATDTPIDEFASIERSLILRAAPGFHPTVSFGGAIFAPGPTMTVVVRDITFGDGIPGELRQRLRPRGHLQEPAGDQSLGQRRIRDLQLNASVPVSADFIGNFVRMTGHQSPQIDVHTSQTAGETAVRIIGNKLSGAGPSTGGGGIDLVFNDSGRSMRTSTTTPSGTRPAVSAAASRGSSSTRQTPCRHTSTLLATRSTTCIRTPSASTTRS